MEVTKGQAKEALEDVEAVSAGIRGKTAYWGDGPIMALWGVVWIACFLGAQFAPHIGRWGWPVGAVVGIAGSFWLGWLGTKAQPVRSESAKRLDRKFVWFWLAAFVYASIWLAILWPWQFQQAAMFLVTLVMFAYVVMGLFFRMRFMLWLGLAITAVAGAGYLMSFHVPGYLNLWLGLTGGPALLASGLYLMWRSR